MRILGDRVMVKPIIEKKTESGIFLTNATAPHNKAKVIQTGEKVKKIKSGNVVLYNLHSGTPFPVDGVEYLLLREGKDVISIL